MESNSKYVVSEFTEQENVLMSELRRVLLAFLCYVGIINVTEKENAHVIRDENGFIVNIPIYSDHDRHQAQFVQTSFDFNICKVGIIDIQRKRIQTPSQVPNQIPNLGDLLPDDVNQTQSNEGQTVSLTNQTLFTNVGKDQKLKKPTETVNLSRQTVKPVLPKKSHDSQSKTQQTKFKYVLSSDCDKLLKLNIIKFPLENNQNLEEHDIEGCSVSITRRPNGRGDATIKSKINMGAQTEKVNLFSYDAATNRSEQKSIDVLKINDFVTYKEEIYYWGHMGPVLDPDEISKQKRKNNERVKKFIRYIQFSNCVFEVDFYDFYVYNIIGCVPCLNDRNLSTPLQWPWIVEESSQFKIISPPYNTNDVVRYADLYAGIDDPDEFFHAFENVFQGKFCQLISGSNNKPFKNKRVMQLCLALAYSEPIRNFCVMKWNDLLLSCRPSFQSLSVEALHPLIRAHPMVTSGSFQKPRSGFSGMQNNKVIEREPAFDYMVTLVGLLGLNNLFDK